MINIPTAIPNVFASPETLPLVNQYLSCTAAKQLLSSGDIVKPLFIKATKSQNFAETQSSFNKDYKPTRIEILIPESHLKTKDGLGDLIFEIFNAKTSYVSDQAERLKAAASGHLSMDAFAKSTEISELSSAHDHAELRKQCQNLRLPSDEVVDHLKDQPLEVALFAQDVDCHMDIYRSDWIDQYQTAYCARHPSDTRSCQVRTSDLCDRNQILAMPKQKREKIYAERICKMFLNAHQDVKNHREYQNFVEKKCPKPKIAVNVCQVDVLND